MKVYVYDDSSGELRKYREEKLLSECRYLIKFLGIQDDLPIEPVKKEVVKRKEFSIYSKDADQPIIDVVPSGAYDIIIEYKVKE